MCLVQVREHVSKWLVSSGLYGEVVDIINDEIWEESRVRAQIKASTLSPTLEHIMDEYQKLGIYVAFAIYADVLPENTPMQELVCDALVYVENTFVDYEAHRIMCIMQLMRAGLSMHVSRRAEAALYTAHQDVRLYTMHMHKLVRPHTVSLIQQNQVDAEDAWHFIEGVTGEHDDTDVPKDTLLACPKCKEHQVSYYQRQTRSADEPATNFCTCHNPKCRYRWKFS